MNHVTSSEHDQFTNHCRRIKLGLPTRHNSRARSLSLADHSCIFLELRDGSLDATTVTVLQQPHHLPLLQLTLATSSRLQLTATRSSGSTRVTCEIRWLPLARGEESISISSAYNLNLCSIAEPVATRHTLAPAHKALSGRVSTRNYAISRAHTSLQHLLNHLRLLRIQNK